MKYLPALLLLALALPLRANLVVTALLRGAKAAADITSQAAAKDPIGTNGRIAKHMAIIVERLDLPTDVSPEDFIQALRNLHGDIYGDDVRIFQDTMAAIDYSRYGYRDPKDVVLDTLLDNMARIVHRYAPAKRWHRLFPYISRIAPFEGAGTKEFVTLRRLADPAVNEIARRIPRGHNELADILVEEMPPAFLRPSPETLSRVSPEKAALAVLLIRLSRYGDIPVRQWSSALIGLMASGSSKHFFDPDNDPFHHLRLLFDEEGFLLDIGEQAKTFRQAAAFREQEGDLSLTAAIRFTAIRFRSF